MRLVCGIRLRQSINQSWRSGIEYEETVGHAAKGEEESKKKGRYFNSGVESLVDVMNCITFSFSSLAVGQAKNSHYIWLCYSLAYPSLS